MRYRLHQSNRHDGNYRKFLIHFHQLMIIYRSDPIVDINLTQVF